MIRHKISFFQYRLMKVPTVNVPDAEEAITGLIKYVEKTNPKLTKGWEKVNRL